MVSHHEAHHEAQMKPQHINATRQDGLIDVVAHVGCQITQRTETCCWRLYLSSVPDGLWKRGLFHHGGDPRLAQRAHGAAAQVQIAQQNPESV